ncbi:TonB-dependent receptor [Gilvimarinus xylanilyticus]|uniref:TonB-dependent receptor n=1 Tax=Gilvimarinus xylanilyticus TaxID=2944139 RepID=A0A9X2KT82_9GAMM|nr:TonB-dependent receptor [Gilvimarinus xylanilyticus]MCP8899636.1 TonB-dependent receptor [Gilvimarinus xylanilyticus]
MVYRDNNKKVVPFKKSMLAMCVMAMGTPTLAQEAPAQDELLEEIVVSGTRQNLQNAQDIKRDADTFVDAISAEDIGSLPDRSVLEAMQRMPGVSIERFAAPEDPDHFGVEGSGAVIRGMSATRSEFNGRDSFTANSGRGLNFQDVPPELMSGVDLYKNQTADMIEGGIGGTVSLKTRKPFDQDGQMIAFTGDVSYGDMAEEASPTFSGLYSNRWDTEDLGEFGFLINASYSELLGESNGIQSDAFVKYNADTLGAPSSVADEDNQVWMTNGSNFFTKEDDRVRKGLATSFQWASPNDEWEATAEFIRSDARLSWKENAIKYQGGYGDENDDGSVSETRRARPYPGTEFGWDDMGIFQEGYIVDGGGWRGGEGRVPSGWSGEGDVPDDYVTSNDYFGQKYQADTRFKDTHTIVDDLSFNIKWMPSDSWEFEGDFQLVEATTEDDDLQIANGFYALQQFAIQGDGDKPWLNVIEPWDGRRDANPDYYRVNADYYPELGEEDQPLFPGFSNDPQGDANYFQDPDSYWWRSAMDHYERSEGESKAVRFDATHYFDDTHLLRSVKAGVRFADRNQVVRTTPYNWGSIGAEWAPNAGDGALWLSETEELSDAYEYIDWSDFHRGGVANIPGDGFLFPKEEFLKEVIDGRTVPQANPGAEGIWEPANLRPEAQNGSYFSDAEIYDTTETNKAAYVRLDFGSDDFALRFSGNIGLRYVELERDALGSIQYPDMIGQDYPEGAPTDLSDSGAIRKWAEEEVGPFDPGLFPSEQEWLDQVNQLMAYSRDANNWLSETEQGFGNDADQTQESSTSWDGVLPSLNLKVELTDDLIGRFAVAKAIAMPDMSEVRNQAVLGARQLVVNRETDTSEIVEPGPVDGGVNILSVDDVVWTGSGGNPALQPMESIQYDASLEWYFAPVGSLTTSIFYKDLSNFFIEGALPRTFTNPTTGVSQTVDFTTTRNGEEGKMQGIEIAYQQFYDMLPEPFDGFGIQANYTFIDSEGVPNFTSSADATTEDDLDDSGPDTPQPGLETVDLSLLEGLPLRGQSEHTANLVLMYEKFDWSARLAYNWRSKYLVTTRDVISGQPIWNDDAGFLDGSVQYTVNDYVTLGLQATNLLDTQTKTLMTLDENGRETGRSWFINDRRLALTLKVVY